MIAVLLRNTNPCRRPYCRRSSVKHKATTRPGHSNCLADVCLHYMQKPFSCAQLPFLNLSRGPAISARQRSASPATAESNTSEARTRPLALAGESSTRAQAIGHELPYLHQVTTQSHALQPSICLASIIDRHFEVSAGR